MILFYVRHGQPVYSPDSLTPLGKKQAESVAKRLAQYGVDEIYSSTSKRAIDTARPSCELLCKEMRLIDFAREDHAYRALSYTDGTRRSWAFAHPTIKALFASPELLSLGERWYEHPALAEYSEAYREGIARIRREGDAFLRALGYEHIEGTGAYRVICPNEKRIAIFAHQGFGLAFLSCLLDIPYPRFSLHFDMCHSGMTVIEFKEENGIALPKIITMGNDGHLFRDGLPTSFLSNRPYRYDGKYTI